LVFYLPDEVEVAFWAQVLSVYSLLLTCGISILKVQLTRIHAILTAATAGSPLNVYIALYAIRSIFGGKHRLAAIVGPKKFIPRTVVLAGVGVWTGVVVYIILPDHLSHFTQTACEKSPVFNDTDGHARGATFVQTIVQYFLFMAFVVLHEISETSILWTVMATMPIILAVASWVIAILRRREEIWQGKGYSPRVKTV